MCRKYPNKSKLVVVEGNRRLAACLIITGDQRAARQKGARIDLVRFGKNTDVLLSTRYQLLRLRPTNMNERFNRILV